MHEPPLPIPHCPTGIGTSASHVVELLRIGSMPCTAHEAQMPGVFAPTQATHFDRSVCQWIRTSAEPTHCDRAQNLQLRPDTVAAPLGFPTQQATYADAAPQLLGTSIEWETAGDRIIHARDNDLGLADLPTATTRAWQRGPRAALSDSLHIPPIWCPLALHLHTAGITFQNRSEDFFRRMGADSKILQHIPETCVGELACMYAPTGDAEGVQILSDWLMWALLFDDYYCDGGPISRDATAFNHLVTNMMNFALYPERGPLGDSG
ncbi:hypothetical protein ACW9HQ_37335, partial [Nocardia gipuzkoensis]